jgi:hypothetical protein
LCVFSTPGIHRSASVRVCALFAGLRQILTTAEAVMAAVILLVSCP